MRTISIVVIAASFSAVIGARPGVFGALWPVEVLCLHVFLFGFWNVLRKACDCLRTPHCHMNPRKSCLCAQEMSSLFLEIQKILWRVTSGFDYPGWNVHSIFMPNTFIKNKKNGYPRIYATSTNHGCSARVFSSEWIFRQGYYHGDCIDTSTRLNSWGKGIRVEMDDFPLATHRLRVFDRFPLFLTIWQRFLKYMKTSQVLNTFWTKT